MARAEAATTQRGMRDERGDAVDGRFTLTVLQSPDSDAGTCPLARTEALTIGREAEQGLKLADARISRAHLRIVWEPRANGFRYADLDSTNGTFVNGSRSKGGVLNDNDVLRIGDTLLLFALTSKDEGSALTLRARRSELPVLILGETGVGKERLARAIHDQSGRNGSFTPVNVATLPVELVAAELFGHARGAFSGATGARAGLFRAAQGGTLFLDEVADLAREAQPALLRALQERRIRPVGTDSEVPIDVRIIAATNVDLEGAVRAGHFREDLLARLEHLVVRLLPLRKRRHEILALARSFAPNLELSAGAAEALLLWDWPRNVRELRAVMEALALRELAGCPVRAADLRERVPTAGLVIERPTNEAMAPPEDRPRDALVEALEKHRGNVAATARELGKPRSHVYRWVRHFGLSNERFRRS